MEGRPLWRTRFIKQCLVAPPPIEGMELDENLFARWEAMLPIPPVIEGTGGSDSIRPAKKKRGKRNKFR